MAMAQNESVSRSLMRRSELPNDDISLVDAVIDGENESIMLYRKDDAVHAWLNVCPHAGRRLDYAPGRFLRDEGRLVCAAHGASFDLESGECLAGPCRGAHLRAVPLIVSDTGELAWAGEPDDVTSSG